MSLDFCFPWRRSGWRGHFFCPFSCIYPLQSLWPKIKIEILHLFFKYDSRYWYWGWLIAKMWLSNSPISYIDLPKNQWLLFLDLLQLSTIVRGFKNFYGFQLKSKFFRHLLLMWVLKVTHMRLLGYDHYYYIILAYN